MVCTEGSPTHSARHGPAPLWHHRHSTHSARGRGHIVTDTYKPTKVEGEFGAATATRRNPKSYTPQQRCITVIPTQQKKVQFACLMKNRRNSRGKKEPLHYHSYCIRRSYSQCVTLQMLPLHRENNCLVVVSSCSHPPE
ncbi:hypothetical protein TcCL_NonESM08724 [Trypanosoma cruzi]|nr:hypothetical protein TcCL_NonESM08724 [Trypanosoma cruzi]